MLGNWSYPGKEEILLDGQRKLLEFSYWERVGVTPQVLPLHLMKYHFLGTFKCIRCYHFANHNLVCQTCKHKKSDAIIFKKWILRETKSQIREHNNISSQNTISIHQQRAIRLSSVLFIVQRAHRSTSDSCILAQSVAQYTDLSPTPMSYHVNTSTWPKLVRLCKIGYGVAWPAKLGL